MSESTSFGTWLRQRRKEQGIKPDELAELIGCSPVTLQKVEAGERRPSRQIALLLADYLRIPPDEREAFITFARSGQTGPNAGGIGSNITGSTGEANSPAHAPWRAVHLSRTNLPSVLTPLIGREEQERAARDILLNPKVRLLTFTGAPGIGKTRLAVQVASGLVEHFDDGVNMVELAPIIDPDLVIPTIAQTLGVRDYSGQKVEELLRRHVQGRRMLLVLDNFEQVLDAAPHIARLIEASPWLKVLTTSREALHVRGERRFPVPTLEVPRIESRVQGYSDAFATGYSLLTTVPSVELFVERARIARPDFALTHENAQDIATICIRLDGLPLAIELAAARTALFSPATILTRLKHRFNLLMGGARDLPERQRTLRSTIAWSYDLLDDGEQGLLRTLAVFVGGCTVEAVEAVHNSAQTLPSTTLIELQSLIDKSLLNVSEQYLPKEGRGRETRFSMLETISEYAAERLRESEESQAVQKRHAEYFLRLAEETEPQLLGPEQLVWLDRLEAEHSNMRAALRWALDSEATEIGLRLAGALRWFWTYHSHYAEGLGWARAVLALPGANARNATRAKALWSAGFLAWSQGDSEANLFLEESVSIWRELGDKRGLGNALLGLGMATLRQGQWKVAREIQLESIEMFRAVGDKSGLALALGGLSVIILASEDTESIEYRGEYLEFRALLEEAIQLARETGNKWNLALQLRNMGRVAVHYGDYAEALPLLEESLALQWETGTKHEAAATLDDLAHLMYLEGDLDAALERYENSLEIYRECMDKIGIVFSTANIGAVNLRMGNIRDAADSLSQALELSEFLDSRRPLLFTLELIGWLMGEVGEQVRTTVLLSAVQTLYKASTILLPKTIRIEHERYLEDSRLQMDEIVWQQAWTRGETMSIEEVLEFASESLKIL